MNPTELAVELRSRINPIYAHVSGTESYERRLCAEAIEGLEAELKTERCLSFRNQVAELEAELAALRDTARVEPGELPQPL